MDTPKFIDPIITDQKILRQVSQSTSWKEVKDLNLFERLKASNNTAWTNGAGLAAIQIGIPIRAAWFKYDDKDFYLVNPVIKEVKVSIVNPKEGCLSIPNVWTQTRRHYEVTIFNQIEKEIDGEIFTLTETQFFKEFAALVIQHEIDHMDGILNIDRKYMIPKVAGRNEPCPCGSGLKYKKCCIDKLIQPTIQQEKQ